MKYGIGYLLWLGALALQPLAHGADLQLKSSLTANRVIPADYYWNQFGCNGANLAPRLDWKNAPAGTKSFAITFTIRMLPQVQASGTGWYMTFPPMSTACRAAKMAAPYRKAPLSQTQIWENPVSSALARPRDVSTDINGQSMRWMWPNCR